MEPVPKKEMSYEEWVDCFMLNRYCLYDIIKACMLSDKGNGSVAKILTRSPKDFCTGYNKDDLSLPAML